MLKFTPGPLKKNMKKSLQGRQSREAVKRSEETTKLQIVFQVLLYQVGQESQEEFKESSTLLGSFFVIADTLFCK